MEGASSFRKLAAAMWSRPSDPSIHGSMDVDATLALAFLARHSADTGVRITITNVASEVSGTVRDKDGRGVAGALVVFVPVPQQFWAPVSRRFGRLRTDASGHYSVRGLPPGDYRAAASLELDDRDAYRPDITRAVGEAGVGVSLETLATRVLDLSLTRIPPLRRASAR